MAQRRMGTSGSSYQQLADSINELIGDRRECPCGRIHETPTRQVLIEAGTIEQLPDVLAKQGLAGAGLLVADDNTYQAAGEKSSQVIRGSGRELDTLIIRPEPGQAEVQATDGPVELVQRQATGADYLLAVGSGTINDICKLAATRLDIPYVSVATAPSMTGYTSGIAAPLTGAIKNTIDARPPVAVVADLNVLSAAPAPMRAAGVGDLVSRSLSSTDWKLAALLRGDYFCPYIATMVDEADRHCRAVAPEIKLGQPQAVAVLTAGLILAGVGMKMAGTSAPGSGGGHLMSHYWDMTAPARHRQRSLHGFQVALGDLICAALYERMWPQIAELDLEEIVAKRMPADDFARETYEHYAPLIGSEPAEEVARFAVAKHAEGEELRRQLELVTADPRAFWTQLAPLFTSSEELKRTLQESGAPLTAAELGISEAELLDGYRFARRFRDRYTVLDLAYDLGLLDELRDEVLATAE